MKLAALILLGTSAVLTACTSINDPVATAKSESMVRAYTPLGTLIPKKGPGPGDAAGIDMQSFENNRTMNNASNSALGSSY